MRRKGELDESAERGVIGDDRDRDDALLQFGFDALVDDDGGLGEEREDKEGGEQGEEAHR